MASGCGSSLPGDGVTRGNQWERPVADLGVHHMAWPTDMQCRWERHHASPQAACEPEDWPPNANSNPIQPLPHLPPRTPAHTHTHTHTHTPAPPPLEVGGGGNFVQCMRGGAAGAWGRLGSARRGMSLGCVHCLTGLGNRSLYPYQDSPLATTTHEAVVVVPPEYEVRVVLRMRRILEVAGPFNVHSCAYGSVCIRA